MQNIVDIEQENLLLRKAVADKNHHIKILEEYILSLKKNSLAHRVKNYRLHKLSYLMKPMAMRQRLKLNKILLPILLKFPRIHAAPKDAYQFLPTFLALILFTTCLTTKKSARMMERY
jgi:hypothetical protein